MGHRGKLFDFLNDSQKNITFLNGFISVFDLFGVTVPQVKNKFVRKSDKQVLIDDWEAIYKDFNDAFTEVKRKKDHCQIT